MGQTKREAEVRINYITDGVPHKLTYGVKFEVLEPPSGQQPNVMTKGNLTQDVGIFPVFVADTLKALFSTTTTFSDFEVWDLKNDGVGISQPRFVYSGVIGIDGTSPSPTNQVKQTTFLYRSQNGKVGRFQLFGIIGTVSYTKDGRPFGVAGLETLALDMESANSVIYHSDGSFVSTVYAITSTTNNAMERRVYGRG